MQETFWQSAWDTDRIGFHNAEPNRNLVKYWSTLDLNGTGTVFVPLAGKSLDMLWLAERGHSVLGNELILKAVEDFFAENRIDAVQTRLQTGLTRFESQSVTVLQGDFFALTPEDTAGVTAAYDRASLVALPPDLRERYARHFTQLMPSGSKTMLVSFEYDQTLRDGPPFSVSQADIQALYSPDFDITQLASKNVRSDPDPRNRFLVEVYQLVRN